MNTTISIPAYFDGTQILLDEPFELEPNVKLIFTVLPDEREDWRLAAKKNLARAYGDDEPEYELSLIRERNPEYEGNWCRSRASAASRRDNKTPSGNRSARDAAV